MRYWASALLAVAVTACSSPSSGTPDASALLRKSASAMSSVHTLAADVKFGPGLVYEGFTLSSAQTQVALPSSSDTTLKVRQQDFLVDVRVVTTAGHVWVKVPFGKFSELTPAQAGEVPDLAAMFDPQRGLPALLASGRNPKYGGTEKVGATDCDKVTATYGADQVGSLVPGVKPAGDVQATLWMGRSDHRLYRVLLTGPLTSSGQSTSVDVTIHDYDAPVTIAQPTP